jgi:hypothetical protein
LNQTITLEGYGRTDELNNDFGVLRSANNTIRWLGARLFGYYGPGNTCNGDSGGPAFARVGGADRVLGVTSFGTSTNCQDWSFSETLDDAVPWLVTASARDIRVDTWQNPDDPLDVDGNGVVAPIDALLVINYISAGLPTTLPAINTYGYFIDVNGDGIVSPLDALLVINALNS